jgi:hypothetical protein
VAVHHGFEQGVGQLVGGWPVAEAQEVAQGAGDLGEAADHDSPLFTQVIVHRHVFVSGMLAHVS